MDLQKVDLFLSVNSENFPPQNLPFIRERLQNLDENKWIMLQSMQFKKPTTSLLISIFLGSYGIDRFMIGDTGLGVGKLLTCGGMGIWTIIDWFKIQDATRNVNYQKLLTLL